MDPAVCYQAIRLDLVAKSRGVAAADKYFMDLQKLPKLISHMVLFSIVTAMTEKAEALEEKMKELNFAFTAMSYNSSMTLYPRVNKPEKVPVIIKDMKEDDVLPLPNRIATSPSHLLLWRCLS